MSLFLDFPCLLSGCSKVISAAWCVVEPICAFSTNDHCISFYLEEGVSLERCRILRKSDATAIAWHPTAKVIAAGWGDGSISVWDLSPLSSSEVSPRDLADTLSSTCIFTDSSGQAPIRTVMWNPSATRLVSANNSGAILIWKADNRGGLSLFKGISIGSGVTCAVFTPLSLGLVQTDALAQGLSSSLFLGTRRGSVHYIDDLGRVSEVQTLGAYIDHMLFFEKKSRLVVLTRTFILAQLEIRSDCKVVPIMKMKVSVAGGSPERGIKHVCWAGPGIIAAATGEVPERSGLSVSKFNRSHAILCK
mmetsp:Transcript_8641/g.24589  ORF Transcript_8641/g.24589 Transcript_8641/m.24589 type:complete len:305 (+) Transcript_8641:105-1019(+)